MDFSTCESPYTTGNGSLNVLASPNIWSSDVLSQLDVLGSPNNCDSNISFTMSPCRFSPTSNSLQGKYYDTNQIADCGFSPSLFSPNRKGGHSSKLLKKRNYYRCADGQPSSSSSASSSSSSSLPGKAEHAFNLTEPHHDDDTEVLNENKDTETEQEENDSLLIHLPPSSHSTSNRKGHRNPIVTEKFQDSNSTETIQQHDSKSSSKIIDSPAFVLRSKLPGSVSPADGNSNEEFKSKCNCKKSRCLKLYCECFAASRYCDSCNCFDCNNIEAYDSVRDEAIKLTKERNPMAFQSKVTLKKGPLVYHIQGCNCKQTNCLKKYCECFQGNAYCGSNCKCKSCSNFEGSHALEETRSSNASASNIISLRENNKKRKESPSSVACSEVLSPTTPTSNVAANQSTAAASTKAPVESSISNKSNQGRYRHSAASATDNGAGWVKTENGTASSSRSTSYSLRNGTTPAQTDTGNVLKLSTRKQQGACSVESDSLGTRNSSRLASKKATGTSGIRGRGAKMGHAVSNDNSYADADDDDRGDDDLMDEDLEGDENFTDLSAFSSSVHSSSPTGRQWKKRKVEFSSATNDNCYNSTGDSASTVGGHASIVYPFFGQDMPCAPKIVALRCLDFMDGPNIYAMSLVSSIWNKAAMDNALWE